MEYWVLILFCGNIFASFAPNENSGLFEGDIVLDPDQQRMVERGDYGFAATKLRLWPTTIAYQFSSDLKNNARIRKGVEKAFKHYRQHTCIRFVPRTFEREYLHFYDGSSCNSHVGSTGGERRVSLESRKGSGCDNWQVIVHELMHALGFWHEQSRPDRDNYVKILWDNIYPSSGKGNFRKYGHDKIDSLGVPYDFDSILHYTGTAWSGTSRRITIQTLDPSKQHLINGTRSQYGLSKLDIVQINKLYKCDGNTSKPPPTAPPCQDFYSRCQSYKSHCNKNTAMGRWVGKDCKKTCNLC